MIRIMNFELGKDIITKKYGTEDSEKFTQTYSSRKVPDSPRGFGIERAGKIDQRALR